MKVFCKEVLLGKQLTIKPLMLSIGEYLELHDKSYTSQDIQHILQLLQIGMVNISHMVKEYCRKKEYSVTILTKDDIVLNVFIE